MRSYRTATQWGVYDVCVKNGELISVSGIKEDPDPSKFSQQPFGWCSPFNQNKECRQSEKAGSRIRLVERDI